MRLECDDGFPQSQRATSDSVRAPAKAAPLPVPPPGIDFEGTAADADGFELGGRSYADCGLTITNRRMGYDYVGVAHAGEATCADARSAFVAGA